MNKNNIFLSNLATFMKMGYTFEDSIKLCKDYLSNENYNKIKECLENGLGIDDIIIQLDLLKKDTSYFKFLSNKKSIVESIEKSLQIIEMKQMYKDIILKKLSYPLLLIIFLFFFSIFITFFMLPKVNILFISFNIERNLIFEIIYNLFSIIPVLMFISIFLMFYIICVLLYSIKNKKFYIVNQYMKLPPINKILKLYFSLKFSIYYNEFIDQFLDNKEIIKFFCDEFNDYDIKFIFYEVLLEMNNGKDLFESIISNIYLEEFFKNVIKMTTENHTQILDRYIKMTYQKLQLMIEKFINIVVPAIYLFVAFFVISVYVSIIIPMMNIMSNI